MAAEWGMDKKKRRAFQHCGGIQHIAGHAGLQGGTINKAGPAALGTWTHNHSLVTLAKKTYLQDKKLYLPSAEQFKWLISPSGATSKFFYIERRVWNSGPGKKLMSQKDTRSFIFHACALDGMLTCPLFIIISHSYVTFNGLAWLMPPGCLMFVLNWSCQAQKPPPILCEDFPKLHPLAYCSLLLHYLCINAVFHSAWAAQIRTWMH